MEQNKMAAMPMRKLLLEMSVPLMLSLLIQSLYNIVDGIFVARLSENALTATSLVYAVQFLMVAASVGTSVGLNALLSQKLGKGKPEEACRVATTGIILMLVTASLFTVVGVFFSDPIARAMTSDPELQELCKEYMGVCVVFCHGMFLHMYGQRLLQAVGDTMLSMVTLIISAGTNIILDPIMIFGLLGCPAMGIRGGGHCHRHRPVHGRSLGPDSEPLEESHHSRPPERVPLGLAGCGRHLPGGSAHHGDAGHRQRHDLRCQRHADVCLLHGGGLLRGVLQAAKLPDDAAERPGPGGHPHRGL
ncbi:MAG: hypothetical protein LUE61_03730 [Clostridiales bacterium]|nr:hypothetical protein [Clostridiales bacterium]